MWGRNPLVMLIVSAAVLVSGCASSIPEEIRKAPAEAPSIRSVLADPEGYLGQKVRWGGEIQSIINAADSTRIEVVQRPLYGDGYPESADPSLGRFIVVVDGFVDPVEAKDGRRLTVYGTLAGVTEQLIGQYAYRYPEVHAEKYVLWEARTAQPYPHPHYRRWPWYDPWYDPWYRPWYRPHPRDFPRRY